MTHRFPEAHSRRECRHHLACKSASSDFAKPYPASSSGNSQGAAARNNRHQGMNYDGISTQRHAKHMRVSLLCSDPVHPINERLRQWVRKHRDTISVEHVHSKSHLTGGDFLFLLSCTEHVDVAIRSAYRHTLVMHASDLPRGRGWSPHIWALIGGATNITVSLIEAEDRIDSGRVWHQILLTVPKHMLWDDINVLLFDAEIALLDVAIDRYHAITPKSQDPKIAPTYFRRRTSDDSEIDPFKSIAEQFDHIRVCDPRRYPAFFILHGTKYKITLEKLAN